MVQNYIQTFENVNYENNVNKCKFSYKKQNIIKIV